MEGVKAVEYRVVEYRDTVPNYVPFTTGGGI
jgi:hypothetical protein